MIPIKKYYANKDGQITVQCPSCETIRTISVDCFKNKKHEITIKCSCLNVIGIDIEFRQCYRKKVNIYGNYKYQKDLNYKDCVIVDLSLTGVAVKITNDSTIKKEDELIINFILDNNKKSKIEKKIIVRHADLERGIIGGEFIHSNIKSHDIDIYYYLS